ncbi:MAG: NAD(P)/FAD-dependent oxidoreductase [Candidatus Binatia bacterium]
MGAIVSDDRTPHVVIVGGGFGGLAAARALRHAPVRVTVLDRRNHHLFQPLLYQVATAVLAPGEIAAPIRQLLRTQRNATVGLLEVTGIDVKKRLVLVDYEGDEPQSFPYDYLVLATGVEQSYFGHDEFAKVAPGLKSLDDATAVRARVLRAFEVAEMETDPSRHRDLLTFVLVGAGPSGVEMAGALAQMARMTLKADFRRIDPTSARIVLVEGGPRILATFAEELSRKAHERLRRAGVEIRTGTHVEHIDDDGVVVDGERIASRTVIWTAGVKPSPAGTWLGAPTDHAGRVLVQPDLSVPGLPQVFVVGDTAHLEQDGKPLPGVAQVALQEGRYAGQVIASRVAGRPAPSPFRYFDKGNLAVIGRNFAILESGRLRLAGFPAWCVWAGIHLAFLPATGNRLMVARQWAWTYLTKQLGSRLIIGTRARK